MRKFRINPSLLISMVALFVALGGVSYAAATIGSAEIKNNSVRSKDVKNGDLRGKDLKADTIGGSRVLESSLAKVPSAASADNATNATNAQNADKAADADTVGGVAPAAFTVGRSGYDATCEPGALESICLSVPLTLPRAGRVSVTTGGQWHSDDAAGTSVRGTCRTTLNGASFIPSSDEGTLSNQTDGNQESALTAGARVSNVLPAGTHTLAIRCADDVGDMDFTDLQLSAVMLGTQ
jgi:hypothetical protein